MPEDRDDTYEELKAEQDELNEEETYLARYGFKHECRCAEDWAEGNWAVVSVCYVSMIGDALDALEAINKEHRELKAKYAELQLGVTDAKTEG